MPHKNCIDFNQADRGQLETSDCSTLTQWFGAKQHTNAIVVVVNVPHEQENQGQHVWGSGLRTVWHSVSNLGAAKTPPCSQWEVWAGSLHLALVTNTNFILPPPQPFLFRALTHYWLCSEKDGGFVHCWLHGAEGTISASSKPSIKSGLGAKQAQETLLNLLSQESLTARKDALMGTLHSQAKLPLESLPPLCQLIKP